MIEARRRGFVFAVATLLAAAPALAQSAIDLGPPEPDAAREWTLMIYLDADNDLEPFALADLNEMEAGLPDSGVEVVVLIDRASGYDDSDGDWQDARVLRLRHDTDPAHIGSEVLAHLGEINMGDPATLSAFLAAAIQRFPARRYAAVLWDHGGGWQAMAIDHDAPGTAEGHDRLDLPEVGAALRDGLAAAGLAKLDIIGFDMCLMAQIETAYELKDLAKVMVASQAVEPGDGWPYHTILPAFGAGTLGPRRIGAAIVEAYGRFYDERNEAVGTQSAIDLSMIGEVAGAVDAIATATAGSLAETWSEVSRSLFFSETYADRTDLRRDDQALASVDLLDMFKRVRASAPAFPAEAAYRDLVDAMDRAVIANYRTPRHRLSTGLAIYAPVIGAQYNAAYANNAFARDTAWPRLLGSLYQTQQANLSAPRITELQVVDLATGAPVRGGKPGGGFGIRATVEGENVLWVETIHALWDEDNNGHLVLEKGYVFDPDYYAKKQEAAADAIDLLMPEFEGARNVVSEEFVGHRFYVSDGNTAGLATIDGSSLSDLSSVGVPVVIERAGVGEHFATVFFDLVTWQATNVVAEVPQPDDTIAYRQVEPEAGDRITLLFEFIPADGGDTSYLGGETLQWGDGLELILGNDDPGEITVGVRAESIGGLSDFVTTTIVSEPLDAQEQAFLDNARKVEPGHLVGRWRWHKLDGETWQPTPLVTEITPWDRDPSILVATTTSDQDAGFTLGPSEVVLDTRLTPTLRFIDYDDDGRPLEAQVYSMLVSRWDDDNSPRMILKYLVPAGWLIMLAREGGGGAPNPPQPAPPPQVVTPQPQPQPQPAPQQGLSLAGLWQNPDGLALAMNATNYELYDDQELIDSGAYQVVGNQFVTQNAYGEQESYGFQIQGDQFALQDEYGDTYIFTRVR